MTWQHATRNLQDADSNELAAMRDAANVLIENERRLSPDVLTSLCQIREETAAELRKRVRPIRASSQAAG
jgi:hypothetical protein